MPVLSPAERREVETSILDLDFIAEHMILSQDAKSRILANVARLRDTLHIARPVPPVSQRVHE